jgi:pimeloyl-ACP methyl ester carboxylesterase
MGFPFSRSTTAATGGSGDSVEIRCTRTPNGVESSSSARRPEPAFIYGHSLGGAVAIELALRRAEAAGLILEGTFTSMSEIAKTVYWMFPVDWLLNQRFDTLAKVPTLQPPFSSHGGRGSYA